MARSVELVADVRPSGARGVGRTGLTIEVDRDDDGRWVASVPALLGVRVHGASRDEALSSALAIAQRVLADEDDADPWIDAPPTEPELAVFGAADIDGGEPWLEAERPTTDGTP